MEAHAAQEERHEQGKRKAKLEAGFAEVALQLSISMNQYGGAHMATCCSSGLNSAS